MSTLDVKSVMGLPRPGKGNPLEIVTSDGSVGGWKPVPPVSNCSIYLSPCSLERFVRSVVLRILPRLPVSAEVGAMSWTWKTSGPGLVWDSTRGFRFVNWETASYHDSGGGWQLSQNGGYAYTGQNHQAQWDAWVTSQTSQILPTTTDAEWMSVMSGATPSGGPDSSTPSGSPDATLVMDPASGATADPEWLAALANATGSASPMMSDPISEKHLWWAQGWRTCEASKEAPLPIQRDDDGAAAVKRRHLSPNALTTAMKSLPLGNEKRELEMLEPQACPGTSSAPVAKYPRRSRSFPQ